MNIKIGQQLFPIAGLSTTPSTPEDEVRLTGDVQPTLAILTGIGLEGLVAIEVTADGSIKSADTGSGLEVYQVFNGTTTASQVELDIGQASASITIQVKTSDMNFSFQNVSGTWGANINLSIGWHSFDFSYSDIRVIDGAASATYQILVFA